MRFAMVLGLALGVAAASGCDYTTIYEGATASDAGAEGDAMRVQEWSGNFGQSDMIPCSPSGTAENPGVPGVALVDIAANDGRPAPISIVLNAPPLDNAITTRAELVAVIMWSTGGVQARAEVDFVNGQVLNLVASAVRVHVVQQMLPDNPVPGFARAVRASAFASQDALPRASRPQRTRGFDFWPVLAPNFTRAIVPPRFSKDMRLTAWPRTSAVDVLMYDDLDIPNVASQQAVVAFPSDPLPLPGDLSWSRPSIVLQNIGGANISSLRAIFDLEF